MMVVTKKQPPLFLNALILGRDAARILTINPSSYLADSLALLFSDKTML
jgi:hypothetical protein